jgi:hypothetical protein
MLFYSLIGLLKNARFAWVKFSIHALDDSVAGMGCHYAF